MSFFYTQFFVINSHLWNFLGSGMKAHGVNLTGKVTHKKRQIIMIDRFCWFSLFSVATANLVADNIPQCLLMSGFWFRAIGNRTTAMRAMMRHQKQQTVHDCVSSI